MHGLKLLWWKSPPYPGILLDGNEHALLQLQTLGCKKVQIGLLFWLLLGFTFLDPLNF